MMFGDNLIVNKFREWDKFLLVNHPRLWALRLPALVGYFVVFNLLAVVICFAFPLRLYHVTSMTDWLSLFRIVELIPLGFWLWKFSRFSPEKELEQTFPAFGMVEILLYMLCIFIMISPTLTSSVILNYRFTKMLTQYGAESEFGQLYLDFDEYKNFTANYEPWVNNHEIEGETPTTIYLSATSLDIKPEYYYDWKEYLITATQLLQISILMFAFRHIKPRVFGKSIAYWIGISVVYAMIQFIVFYIFTDYSSYSPFSSAAIDNIISGTELILLVLILFFSLRVFWQKKYYDFTGMNITILPILMYTELNGWVVQVGYQMGFQSSLYSNWIDLLEKTFGGVWAYQINYLIIGSPILILPLYILIKAMYMRLLALPEG